MQPCTKMQVPLGVPRVGMRYNACLLLPSRYLQGGGRAGSKGGSRGEGQLRSAVAMRGWAEEAGRHNGTCA